MPNKISDLFFDESLYSSYYQKYQQEYIRKKLKTIKIDVEGYKFSEILGILEISDKTARKHIKTYPSGGFELLCKKTKRPKKESLTETQRLSFKEVVIKKVLLKWVWRVIFGQGK